MTKQTGRREEEKLKVYSECCDAIIRFGRNSWICGKCGSHNPEQKSMLYTKTSCKEKLKYRDEYYMRKLREQKGKIIKLIKENTIKNRYRDGETAFDIVRDIEENVRIVD